MSSTDFSALRIEPGSYAPLGATPVDGGVQFALVSNHASKVWLALYESPSDGGPAAEFAFEPGEHRFGSVWSMVVKGAEPGLCYAYRAELPEETPGAKGDASRALLDPYARVIQGEIHLGTAKCIVMPPRPFSVQERRPRIPLEDTVIYETHVRGLTMHPSSGVENPGTYRALVEKLPYLKDLGVTAVELLPVQECGDRVLKRKHPATGKPLINYWGYNTVGFCTPSAYYASDQGPGAALEEFRAMADAIHEAGMEVILDVVYNHTAEGGDGVLSFRGIDPVIYYLMKEDGANLDVTGCGNTLNCNHPVVQDLILESLRYWVTVMGVDGFRFDLACVLNRDSFGYLHGNAAVVSRIADDPVLRDVKLIAEAWDLGGGYQVGQFGSPRWSDWNDRFRNDVRRFWRGDQGSKGDFARRLTGSPDLYQATGRGPLNSVNYICSHDGFTLRDLVSYNRKHNLANGEHNRDGTDYNLSWNCGVEGETDDGLINALRLRMQKNYLATLFLSLGVPMLCGGDEFGRTQKGNNNAYCQDNELSWYDWSLVETNAELHRFCREMVRFRAANPALRRATYYTGQPADGGDGPDMAWFDPAGRTQTWDASSLALACMIDPACNDGKGLYMLFNASMRTIEFALPAGDWEERIDTARTSPRDIRALDGPGLPIEGEELALGPKALVVLRMV